METYESRAKPFKISMHPLRLAILNILRHNEECGWHTQSSLGLHRAYISQRLTVFGKTELVENRREIWNIFHRISKPKIFAGIVFAKHFIDDGEKAIDQWLPPIAIQWEWLLFAPRRVVYEKDVY